jgi:hypothetical protein
VAFLWRIVGASLMIFDENGHFGLLKPIVVTVIRREQSKNIDEF